MRDSDIQRIEHIRDYCLDVRDTTQRFGVDYEIFLSDKDYYKSVSMSIMQIGELSAGLSDGFKENSKTQIQWGPNKSMRNMFAHTYIAMDKDVIWETAIRDIPVLLCFCEQTLELYQELAETMDKETDEPAEDESQGMTLQ